MRALSLLFVTLSLYQVCLGYKFLLMFAVPSKSLNILGHGIARHLLQAGHEVTYATVYPIKSDNKNFRQIDLHHNIHFYEDSSILNISYIMENKDVQTANDLDGVMEMMRGMAKEGLENKDLQKILKDPNEKFDAVIVELMEIELYVGLAALYDCPMIWSWSMGPSWDVVRIVDGPSNPSYTADFISTNVLPFTFWQRAEELWTQIDRTIKNWWTFKPAEKAIYDEIFQPLFALRGRSLPDFYQQVNDVALIIANDHIANGNFSALPQNFKLLSGYHIEHPPKPLPKDLQNLMDSAKHGVIYFSMGSTWHSKDIPTFVTDSLLKMFGQLKETVIWKYEADLPNLPSNVHILKWAPQQSILAHPDTRVFITHGGFLSSTETIHFGVPTIALPIYFDQFLNANKAVSRGYALKVDLSFNLAEDLKVAIDKMLQDPSYRNKIKSLSQIYHDRLVSPGRELVHWVEHVVRTGGAPHLRSPALMVPWYQKMYLDLLAIIIVVISLIILAIKRLIGCEKKVDLKKKTN